MLDDLNKSLFLLINAKEGDADVVRLAAVFLAQYFNWVVGLGLTAYLLATKQPKLWLKLLGSCAVALVLAYVIGKLYYHPRPFILGLGQTVVGQARHIFISQPPPHFLLGAGAAFMRVCTHAPFGLGLGRIRAHRSLGADLCGRALSVGYGGLLAGGAGGQ